jgi:hypothetical protein
MRDTISTPNTTHKRAIKYNNFKKLFILLGVCTLSIAGCETLPERITAPQKREAEVENYLLKKKVTTPPPPTTKGKSIAIDTTNQRAWLFDNGIEILSSPVTPGKPSSPTPKGKFWVINKHKDWTSTIYHVPMPYFLRLNPGYFGLHEGPMQIYPASHGCIRLPKKQASEFFELTPIGTKVLIY